MAHQVLEEKIYWIWWSRWWRWCRGGSIILKAEQNLNTLIDYRYQQHHKAQRGENGAGQNRTGKGGENLILKVPLGTQVFEEDNKTLIYDFTKIGEEFVAANGGKGGLGNTRFKSSTNRAPRKFTKGTLGEEFVIWLQLKQLQIRIIGLPNAGKSATAAITNANPKIALSIQYFKSKLRWPKLWW